MRSKQLVAGILTFSILLSMGSGCAKKSKSTIQTIENKNAGNAIFDQASGKSAKSLSSDKELKKAYSEFVLGMVRRCAERSGTDNFLISADSVLFALEMTAAGADGDTLDQMLGTLLPGTDKEDAFLFAVDRMSQLKSNQLKIANSVWINDNFNGSIYSDYLKYVERNFDAQIGSVPFNNSGVNTINSWVKDNTDGMIPELVEELNSEDVMVLVNALAFDAKWKKRFESQDIESKTFHRSDGTDERCQFLCGENDVAFLYNDSAVGFFKRYEGEKYAFMVILPGRPADDYIDIEALINGTADTGHRDEEYRNTDINEFLTNMTAEDYWKFWNSYHPGGQEYEVEYAFPEFTSEYSTSLKDILKDMGMEDAFSDSAANFENMSDLKPLFIGDVIHTAKIEVNAEGTKAAASTGVVMEHNGVATHQKVICDHPFAYAIVDVETGLPIFFGTVEHVNE